MLQSRPPIITVLGHVDHGKTTLLDHIRHTKVQEGEVGGITQHIGAYQITFQGKKITFIDTPGHSAFNKMRERGAKITDLVILVVSVKDGVKPQTIESIRFIKEAKAPFIVALNKIDAEGANPTLTKTQLAEQNVVVQEYGGDIDAVEISALTGKGVDKLLENVLLMAELLDLKADPDASLEAVVIESTKDQHKGPVVRVIVQQGTLVLRQEILVDGINGRVRSLVDENGRQLQEVVPGQPAEVLGLNDVPEVGTILHDAKATYKTTELPQTSEEEFSWDSVDVAALLGDKEKLNLIVKADVKGTLEAIVQSLDTETVELISASVGALNESDLELAQTTGSVVVVFGQNVPSKYKHLAKELGVHVKQYEIIYHLLEDLEEQMLKLMDPYYGEVELGSAEIMQIFDYNNQRIAGIRVITGEINRHDKLYLKRADQIIARPVITSMKHGKDDIQTVKTKGEAGLAFKNKKLDFQVGDVLVAYKIEI
ncbi:MAG TPA: translation initiation factor IF-2 [Candidatus Woesebacteria bacterium]|nr:translation initiation factor IF-2 [Candidatus Woesebacteria bacterium]